MTPLSPEEFPNFFDSIYGYAPFDWQIRLMHAVTNEGWPDCVAAPTGAGKTAVLDIALYHLACELANQRLEPNHSPRRAPMRIVLAVDRRVIVDQAFERAKKIRDALIFRKDETVKRVAEALGKPPHVAELRGGIPREDDWAKTPVQPTILCTTVDQLGSRLLFRGYGVSQSMAPIHAGLLGRDALIFLDEAHLSTAFLETLSNVARFQCRAHDSALASPWRVCALTATPRAQKVFRLHNRERRQEKIARRLKAEKVIELVKVGEPSGSEKHAQEFAARARSVAKDRAGPTIAIIVNRVKLARAIFDELKRHHEAILLTGRARPLERQRLVDKYGTRLMSGRGASDGASLYVVATQCIEAGADYDFDAMVSQIAPLDSLRQRFGRLDRLGERGPTHGVVIATKDEIAAKTNDPIYGDRSKKTWEWLAGAEGRSSLDFGPDAMDALIEYDPEGAGGCAAMPKSAPVLRAVDVEFFTMTNPRPHPEPHLPLFLHGDPAVDADVSIVWRADLPGELDEKVAKEIIDCMPPRATEALAVPLWEARKWLADEAQGNVSDLEGADREDEEQPANRRKVMRWRGAESAELVLGKELRPGDTIIVPAVWGGCDSFGWAPQCKEPVADLADAAGEPYAARRAVLRLHKNLWPFADEVWEEVRRLLAEHRDGHAADLLTPLCELISQHMDLGEDNESRRSLCNLVERMLDTAITKGKRIELEFPYDSDSNSETPTGAVLIAPRGLADTSLTDDLAEAVSEDDDSGSFRRRALPLDQHLMEVEAKAREFASGVGLPQRLRETVAFAAAWHDKGKADPRFQMYLAGGVEPGSKILAKSGRPMAWGGEAVRIRATSGFRGPWRHEALSVRLATQALDPAQEDIDAALALFLIGSHHGQGRPFFRHDDPWDDYERTIEGKKLPPGVGPHRLDFDWGGRDWAEIFEELNARYGAWGLAYLEAILRLADHRASEEAEKEAT